MKKVILSLAVFSTLLFSCSNNEKSIETPITEAPTAYSFERNGATSVSFSGQTTRIEMGDELVSVLNTTTETVATLNGKFAHSAGDADFLDTNLNESSKSLRSKTAASVDFFSANATDAAIIKGQFDTWIAAQVNDVFPAWNNDASAGLAGKVQESGGGSTRHINAKGLEYNQAINKGLIGALMVDQMLNNYLSTAVLDEASNRADNDAGTLVSGENYTTMEHKWDEAFGYLYGKDDAIAPLLNVDKFLNKYLSRVDGDSDFTGISSDIYDAFKLGRAAIVNKDYLTRDAQANIIKEKVSEIVGNRAVYYLQQGKKSLSPNRQDSFHDLSEGLGFVYSLQFTRIPNSNDPYFTKAEVDGFMSTLQSGNGFWDITETTLQTMSETIAAKFNFTVEEAAD